MRVLPTFSVHARIHMHPRAQVQSVCMHMHMPMNYQEMELRRRCQPSDGSLQRGHCVCLDDCLGRLGLHHDDLAEHLPLACLGRRLHSCLDHAESWDGDLAV